MWDMSKSTVSACAKTDSPSVVLRAMALSADEQRKELNQMASNQSGNIQAAQNAVERFVNKNRASWGMVLGCTGRSSSVRSFFGNALGELPESSKDQLRDLVSMLASEDCAVKERARSWLASMFTADTAHIPDDVETVCQRLLERGVVTRGQVSEVKAVLYETRTEAQATGQQRNASRRRAALAAAMARAQRAQKEGQVEEQLGGQGQVEEQHVDLGQVEEQLGGQGQVQEQLGKLPHLDLLPFACAMLQIAPHSENLT